MNYTQLVTRFWRLDDECHFSAAATRLYLMLLDHFSRVGFDRSITWTNGMAMEHLAISLNAYIAARDMLVTRGLLNIAEEAGRGKRSHRTVYTLPSHTVQPVEEQSQEQPAQQETDPGPAPVEIDPETAVMDFDRCAEYLLSPAGEEFRREITAEYGIEAFPKAFENFRYKISVYGIIDSVRTVRKFKRMFITEYCRPRNGLR